MTSSFNSDIRRVLYYNTGQAQQEPAEGAVPAPAVPTCGISGRKINAEKSITALENYNPENGDWLTVETDGREVYLVIASKAHHTISYYWNTFWDWCHGNDSITESRSIVQFLALSKFVQTTSDGIDAENFDSVATTAKVARLTALLPKLYISLDITEGVDGNPAQGQMLTDYHRLGQLSGRIEALYAKVQTKIDACNNGVQRIRAQQAQENNNYQELQRKISTLKGQVDDFVQRQANSLVSARAALAALENMQGIPTDDAEEACLDSLPGLKLKQINHAEIEAAYQDECAQYEEQQFQYDLYKLTKLKQQLERDEQAVKHYKKKIKTIDSSSQSLEEQWFWDRASYEQQQQEYSTREHAVQKMDAAKARITVHETDYRNLRNKLKKAVIRPHITEEAYERINLIIEEMSDLKESIHKMKSMMDADPSQSELFKSQITLKQQRLATLKKNYNKILRNPLNRKAGDQTDIPALLEQKLRFVDVAHKLQKPEKPLSIETRIQKIEQENIAIEEQRELMKGIWQNMREIQGLQRGREALLKRLYQALEKEQKGVENLRRLQDEKQSFFNRYPQEFLKIQNDPDYVSIEPGFHSTLNDLNDAIEGCIAQQQAYKVEIDDLKKQLFDANYQTLLEKMQTTAQDIARVANADNRASCLRTFETLSKPNAHTSDLLAQRAEKDHALPQLLKLLPQLLKQNQGWMPQESFRRKQQPLDDQIEEVGRRVALLGRITAACTGFSTRVEEFVREKAIEGEVIRDTAFLKGQFKGGIDLVRAQNKAKSEAVKKAQKATVFTVLAVNKAKKASATVLAIEEKLVNASDRAKEKADRATAALKAAEGMARQAEIRVNSGGGAVEARGEEQAAQHLFQLGKEASEAKIAQDAALAAEKTVHNIHERVVRYLIVAQDYQNRAEKELQKAKKAATVEQAQRANKNAQEALKWAQRAAKAAERAAGQAAVVEQEAALPARQAEVVQQEAVLPQNPFDQG